MAVRCIYRLSTDSRILIKTAVTARTRPLKDAELLHECSFLIVRKPAWCCVLGPMCLRLANETFGLQLVQIALDNRLSDEVITFCFNFIASA